MDGALDRLGIRQDGLQLFWLLLEAGAQVLFIHKGGFRRKGLRGGAFRGPLDVGLHFLPQAVPQEVLMLEHELLLIFGGHRLEVVLRLLGQCLQTSLEPLLKVGTALAPSIRLLVPFPNIALLDRAGLLAGAAHDGELRGHESSLSK